MTSNAEAAFLTRWRQLGGPELRTEYRFDPPRRWRFDAALPAAWLAWEIDGGVYSGGRHTRGEGFERDCEKLNRAGILGWLVFRVTPGMIDRDPAGVLTPMIDLAYRRLQAAGLVRERER